MIAQVNGNLLRIREEKPLIQGSVGLTLRVELSEEWAGLAVTALFSAGRITRDVVVSGESITIPWELLAEAEHKLLLSFYGALPNRGSVLTTNIASLGLIAPSLQPSGNEPDAPSPSRADQIQALAEQALSVAQGVRRDADSGAFDGRDGISPTVTVSKAGDTATITVSDASGTQSTTVKDGREVDLELIYNAYPARALSGETVSFQDGAAGIPLKALSLRFSPNA